jgi:hypothetical protein
LYEIHLQNFGKKPQEAFSLAPQKTDESIMAENNKKIASKARKAQTFM